jgi:hypothetical protein
MKRVFHHPGAAAAQITVPDQDDSQVQEIDYVRWLTQMQADLASSLGGVMLRAALPIPIGTAPAGSLRPLSSPGRIVGWSLHETAGANPAVVRLWDGRESGTRPLAYVSVPAGGTDNRWLGAGGVSVTDALLLDFATGAGLSSTVEGVLYLGAAD